MRMLALFAFCAVLLSGGAAQSVSCGGGASCSALASLRVRVSGRGRCRGTAKAACAAFATALSDCDDPVKIVLDSEECGDKEIRAAAMCFAVAVAAVYAKAFVEIRCEGSGEGCGFAHANSEAWACALAAAVVEQQISLGAGQATCDLAVEALAGVFAAAAAEVQENVCVEGDDFAKAFEADFATSIETVLAEAVATCSVKCADGFVVAEGDVEAGVEGGSSVDEGGADTAGGIFEVQCSLIDDPDCFSDLFNRGNDD